MIPFRFAIAKSFGSGRVNSQTKAAAHSERGIARVGGGGSTRVRGPRNRFNLCISERRVAFASSRLLADDVTRVHFCPRDQLFSTSAPLCTPPQSSGGVLSKFPAGQGFCFVFFFFFFFVSFEETLSRAKCRVRWLEKGKNELDKATLIGTWGMNVQISIYLNSTYRHETFR